MYIYIYIYKFVIFQYSRAIYGATIYLAAFSIWRGFCMSGRKLFDPPSYMRCSYLVLLPSAVVETSIPTASKVFSAAVECYHFHFLTIISINN